MRRRLLVSALLAVAGLAAWTGQAVADAPPTVLSLQAPEAAELGESVEVIATLRTTEGEPVSGARVTFAMPAEFAGVAGTMDLGSRATDDDGVAAFRFAPRRSGAVDLVARFPGDDRYGGSEATGSLTVSGERQLYVARAGLSVPILSVLWLAGALGVVFSLYTAVGLLIYGIAREGERVAARGETRD